MSCATADMSDMSSVIKLEARPAASGESSAKAAASSATATSSSSSGASAGAAASQQNPSPSNNNNNNNSGPAKKILPSFNDLLWCPDVDGDVMSQGIGGAMVRRLGCKCPA